MAVLLAFTPVGIALGIQSAGAGHGDYLVTKLLFPWTMLSTFFLGSITAPFIALAIIQYPTYGLILGFANRDGRLPSVMIVLLSIHILLGAVCLIVPNQNF